MPERIKIVRDTSHANIPHLPDLGGVPKKQAVFKMQGLPLRYQVRAQGAKACALPRSNCHIVMPFLPGGRED